MDSRTLKVNGHEITAKEFAFDGCHKIYLINSASDREESIKTGYTLLPINELQSVYELTCGLRFIHNWDLVDDVVEQFEEAVFEGFESAESANAE